MHNVYFIRSTKYPAKVYTGMTNNPLRRLEEHNRGDNRMSYTYPFRPWEMMSSIMVENEETAEIVERYFKNRSGREKFENFAKVNPSSKNPINDYFMSLKVGKAFGKKANGTRFVVVQNEGIPLFKMV